MNTNKKILFADDEHYFIDILKSKFKDFNAQFFYTSGEALAQIKYNKYDVVVLDFDMCLDGTTFVQLANGRLKNSKVYILSHFDKEEIRKRTEKIKDRIVAIYSKDELDLLKEALKGDL